MPITGGISRVILVEAICALSACLSCKYLNNSWFGSENLSLSNWKLMGPFSVRTCDRNRIPYAAQSCGSGTVLSAGKWSLNHSLVCEWISDWFCFLIVMSQIFWRCFNILLKREVLWLYCPFLRIAWRGVSNRFLDPSHTKDLYLRLRGVKVVYVRQLWCHIVVLNIREGAPSFFKSGVFKNMPC